MIDKKYIEPFQNMFREQYETIHRLETNKLRNVAKFFAHLLHTDAISWEVCVALHMKYFFVFVSWQMEIFNHLLFFFSKNSNEVKTWTRLWSILCMLLLNCGFISLKVLDVIKLNEDDTTSASRIFIKVLFQELSEYLGLPKLNDRLKDP